MNSLRVVCSHIKSWNTAAETLISTDTQSTNTYDDVVQGFEANQKELHQLRQQLAAMQADLTAEKVRTSSFEQTIANQRASLRGLETKANKLTGENKSLRVVHATNQKLLLQVRELQRSAAGAHADRKKIMAEQVRYQRLQQDRDQLRQQCILHQQCMKEMQLDLEYLKCTEPARDVVKRTVTPLPFVVVLVDGDAYSVSECKLSLHPLTDYDSGPPASSSTMANREPHQALSQPQGSSATSWITSTTARRSLRQPKSLYVWSTTSLGRWARNGTVQEWSGRT